MAHWRTVCLGRVSRGAAGGALRVSASFSHTATAMDDLSGLVSDCRADMTAGVDELGPVGVTVGPARRIVAGAGP